eukprot:scaffold13_cov241-Pinguiococcus_pyrenoidosus.AAC.9
MIFGSPTTYVQLDPSKCEGRSWDEAVHAANIIYGGGELDGKRYKGRMHNICCDNVMCFSSLPKSSEVRGEERRGEERQMGMTNGLVLCSAIPTSRGR